MFHVDVSDHSQNIALVRNAVDELERQQARAIDTAMDRGMRPEEYEVFVTRRRKIRKLKSLVDAAMLETANTRS